MSRHPRDVSSFSRLLLVASLLARSAAAVDCSNVLAPPQHGLCTVTPGQAPLLLRATILTPADDLVNGELFVDAAGTITCAACDCSAQPGYGTATRLECRDGLVSPGFVNGADFVTFSQNNPFADSGERYEHRHDWRLGQNGHNEIPSTGSASNDQQRWGELRQLLGGTTSSRSQGGQAGLVRNLDGSAALTEGLVSATWDDDNFPFNDTGGERLIGSCAYPGLPSPAVGQPYWMTLGQGIDASAENEFVCASDTGGGAGGVDEIGGAMIVHAIGVTAGDVAEMAAADSTVVWTPRSDLALYGRTAPVTQLARRGVPVALATDWIVTGSGNMQRELVCAELYNRRYAAGRLTDGELFAAATRNAALASAMDDEIGELAPGRKADFFVAPKRDGSARHRMAALRARSEDLELVMRGGVPLIVADSLADAWTGTGCVDAPTDVCGHSARLCLTTQIGESYLELAASVGAAYPAILCGDAVNEPACLPARSQVTGGFATHDGLPKAADFDGDGIANGSDLCPVVFDPANVSNVGQPDADGDLAGDACDFCPTSASATGCGEATATDLVATLSVPGTIYEERAITAVLAVTNAGASAATGRAVLPTLAEFESVSWSCAGSGGGACAAASGGEALDQGFTLPPGASVTWTIAATYVEPGSETGEALVSVASAIPASGLGESSPLDNYAAVASTVVPILFRDGFESEGLDEWSGHVP